VPLLYSWIIALAGWIVPRGLRAQWRRGRETSVGRRWIEGGSRRKVEGELLRFSLDSFRDAYRFQRRERGGGAFPSLTRGLSHAARHPIWVAVILLALVFGPGTIRDVWNTLDSLLWKPMPFREPDRVVLVYPAGPFLEAPPGVLPIKYLAWREKCPSFEALGAYRWREFQAPDSDGRPVRIQAVSVSASLLPLLGVAPALGRGFTEADDRPGAPPAALLAHGLWRQRFNADRRVVGRAIDLDGTLHTIVGVLPEGFWLVSRRTQIWVPLAEDLDPAKDLPPILSLGPRSGTPGRIIPSNLLNRNLVIVAGRLKPNARIEVARYELRSTASRTYPRSGRDWVRVAPVAEVLARALYSPLLVIGATGALATLVALIGMARLAWLRSRGGPQHADPRYWFFFVAKSYVGLAAIGCVWIPIVDPSNGVDLSRGLGEFSGLITTWVFALIACGFLHWSWRDQQLRCHVCLRRVRTPASSGSWAGYLFNRPRTEYLCPAGHGTVSVTPGAPGGPESSDWTDMDDSWRDLFKRP